MLRLIVVLLALIACATPAAARPLDKAAAEARFAEDAANHRKERQGLHRMRSAPVSLGTPIGSIQQVSAWLARDPFTNRGLLFLAFREGALTVYLIDQTGLIEAHETTATPVAIEAATLELRRALRVDQMASHRAPALRGSPRATPSRQRPPSTAKEAARQLADLMLPAPIRARMQDYHSLWIVGDGLFGAIPLALLPLDDTRMLIDEVSLAIAPSLWDLEYAPYNWVIVRQAMLKAAGKSPPYPGLNAARILAIGNPSPPEESRWKPAPLPGAEVEAKYLKDMLGATTLLGSAATKAAVTAAIERHDIIHIAAHGVADPANPLDGGLLMLAGPDEDGAFLTAREVQKMRLEAQLVVLSACQSGLGRAHAGGMIGLSRAFQLAGAPRVVMSLWSVDDGATLFLMERFYHHLMSEGTKDVPVKAMTPAMALRLAMLDGRDALVDPALWASFSVFGSPE